MLRHWFGDTVEQAITLTGVDREKVRKYIWSGVCKYRKKRYHTVATWAERVTTGIVSAMDGKQELEEIVAAYKAER